MLLKFIILSASEAADKEKSNNEIPSCYRSNTWKNTWENTWENTLKGYKTKVHLRVYFV